MTTNKWCLTLHYFALLVAGVIHFSGPKPTYTPKLKNDPSGPSGPARVAEHKQSPRPSNKLGSGNQTVPFSVEATTLRKALWAKHSPGSACTCAGDPELIHPAQSGAKVKYEESEGRLLEAIKQNTAER